MDEDNVIPIRKPEIIAEVGGIVDESRVTLGVYGEELDPDAISAMLRTTPTHAHRKGEQRRPGSPPARQGAWLLSVEGCAPEGPDQLVNALLDRLPTEPGAWHALRSTGCEVRIGFGLFLGAWNRGFNLSAGTMARLGTLGVEVGFDIYAGEESAG